MMTEKEALVGIATVVINVFLLWVNWRTARAAMLSAETTARELLLSRRPLIRVSWEVGSQARGRLLLIATVTEVAGVHTELRRPCEACVDDLVGQPIRKARVAVSGNLLSGTESPARVLVPVELRRGGARVGPVASIRVTLTVSAVGVDDPHDWDVECLLYGDDGAFEVFSSPPRPKAGDRTQAQGLFRRIADCWARWQALNDRIRGQ